MQLYTFTAQLERDNESSLYVGRMPTLPGRTCKPQVIN